MFGSYSICRQPRERKNSVINRVLQRCGRDRKTVHRINHRGTVHRVLITYLLCILIFDKGENQPIKTLSFVAETRVNLQSPSTIV
jgi:hypothetical protein